MSHESPDSSQEISVLQHNFKLEDLLDLESFREVCAGYSDLFQLGLKIFDSSGVKLVDIKSKGRDLCAYLFSFPKGKNLCTREVVHIRDSRISLDGLTEHVCFTGLHYVLAPILHEGVMIGRVVFGPFVPVGYTLPSLPQMGENFDSQTASSLVERVRKTQKQVVHKLVRHLIQTIEVMLYIGYKHALTSRMHLEAATSSYNELQDKNIALEESYRRLKELDRLKSNFLANVSHELRTPLTSVIGYSEMLLEGLAGDLGEEQSGYIKTIMEKGEQLLSLITGILDYSKIESGNLSLTLDWTDPIELVKSAISTVLPMARKHGVRVEVEPKDEIPRIRVDAYKIKQILTNVVGNAVKFNRKDGKVSVRLEVVSAPVEPDLHQDLPASFQRLEEKMIMIAINDTGVGIAPEQQDRIFDSFYQVDSSSTREYGGTGLGLAIAKSLTLAHGGSITVNSNLGKGSEFIISLPVDRGP